MNRAAALLVIALAACGRAPATVDRIASTAANPQSNPAAGPGRVIMVSVDGMMPDVYIDPDAHGLKVPTLRALAAGGASARVQGVMPTVTYPSHTSLITGVPPKLHGIVGNRPLDALGTSQDGWWWYAEDIKVPTLYTAIEAQHRPAALIYWPVTVGAHASYVVPEFWRAGNADDQKLERALATPGLLDEIARSEPALWQLLTPPRVQDHAQIIIARYLLAHHHPELTLIHIFQLDHEQHLHAPWSAEAKATLEAIDGELAQLLGDLQRSSDWPRTTLVVVSDHGFARVDSEIELGVLFVEHGLVRLDETGGINQADVGVVANGGSALVYVLDPTKQAAIDAAVSELGDHARRIEHDELVALGGDPKASFALVPASGFGLSDKHTGELITSLPSHGMHGWPPTDPAMASSFIAFGPRIPHISLGTIDMLDIAPTVARLLDSPLPSAVGKPLAPLFPGR